MPIRGFLGRHGWLLAVAITYLYVFPYFPKIQSANELPRVYLVKAIAEDHGFSIDAGVKRWGPTADVSPSGGHSYSNKAPGSSMLAVPPYAAVRAVAGPPSLGTTMWICRVVAGIVPTLLFLGLMYRFLARYVPEPAIRQLVCLAYALGSMAMTYSLLFYSHQLGASCIASAWIFGLEAAEEKRGLRAFGAAGALAGCAALVDYQAVFAVLPIAVHVIVAMRARPLGDLGKAIAIAGACAAVPIAILLAYHAVCFGSPWRTGYDASTTFSFYHQHGFLGITELRWDAFYGSLVKIDNGLFALAPWLLLAVPGGIVLARGTERVVVSRRALVEIGAGAALCTIAIVLGLLHASLVWVVGPIALGAGAILSGLIRLKSGGELGTVVVATAITVIYVLFISSINFWRGGWGVGPRYIVAVLPFLLPLVAVALAELRRVPILCGVALGTIVVGVVIYTLSSLTFPYWPDSLANPLVDVTFRLLAHDLVAPNLASAAGLDGVAGMLPVLVLVAGVIGFTIWRVGDWRGLGLAVGVAGAMLVGYALLPHGGDRADRAFAFVRDAVISSHR
ncbi:MAG: hypothetical protein ABI867_04100 [Kofleriaceae bacterium]